MHYKDLNLQKERIRDFLRKNPKATWKDIRIRLHVHPERIYKNGLSEAFRDAEVKPPRNFKRKTPEQNRKIIINYIKKHPNTSSHKILRDTKVNPSSFFNSIREAFDIAGVVYPRDIKIEYNDELVKKINGISSSLKDIKRFFNKNKKIYFNNKKKFKLKFKKIYFKNIKSKLKIKNPGHKDLKFRGVIKDTKKFYSERRTIILRNKQIRARNKENKKKEVIKLIREDPLISITEITERTGVHINRYFKNMKGIYDEAGIEFIGGHEKQRLRKKRLVIEYIKENNLATQREINNACKTHVQEIFDGKIFEAYKLAGIKFPYERLRLYGSATKEIRRRAKKFEDKMAIKLSGLGKINRLIKSKRGVADMVLERKNKKAIIEIKDYRSKEISVSQVNQLLKYLEDFNCNLGFLICHKKPEKDRFLFGDNKIFVIEKDELNKIPELMGP